MSATIRRAAVDTCLAAMAEGASQNAARKAAAAQYGVSETSLRRWAREQGRPLSRATVESNRQQVRAAVLANRTHGLRQQRELANALLNEADAYLTQHAIEVAKAGGTRSPEQLPTLLRVSSILRRAIDIDAQLDRRGAPLLTDEPRPMLAPPEPEDANASTRPASASRQPNILDALDSELASAGVSVAGEQPSPPQPSTTYQHAPPHATSASG